MNKRTKQEEALMSRIENHKQAIRKLEVELEQEKLKRAGVAIGEIVVSNGARFRVASVRVFGFGKSWVKANPTRSDGTFGTSVRNLYENWEKA